MASKETILTADGLKKLQEELAQRKGEIREEIVERLKEARAQGDLSASKAAGIVSLGSTVLLKDVETGDEETYTIVGTTEADPFENRISNESPVGAAILGRKVHDVVITKTPVGELSYEIVEIK